MQWKRKKEVRGGRNEKKIQRLGQENTEKGKSGSGKVL